MEENKYKATGSASQQMLLMQNLPESCYVVTEIIIGDARQAGVILQADEGLDCFPLAERNLKIRR